MNLINKYYFTCYYGSFKKGCGKRLIRLVKYILRHGGSVTLICTDNCHVIHKNLTVILVEDLSKYSSINKLLFIIRILIKKVKCISEEETRVFAFDAHNVFYLYSYFLFRPIRITLFVRGNHKAHLELTNTSFIDYQISSYISNYGLKKASKISYNSNFSRDYSKEYNSGKDVSVVFNDIPSHEVEDIEESSMSCLKVGLCGQFIPRKNFLFVVNSLEELLLAGKVRIIIQGDGPDKYDYINYFMEKKLDSHVEVRNWESSINAFFNSIDLLIVPSIFDESPNIILEGFLHGKCVLGSNATGVSELLNHDDELTFDINDNGAKLRSQIECIVGKSARLEYLEMKCSSVSDRYRFNWESKIEEELV